MTNNRRELIHSLETEIVQFMLYKNRHASDLQKFVKCCIEGNGLEAEQVRDSLHAHLDLMLDSIGAAETLAAHLRALEER